jgi:hypothetical protein
MLIIASGDRELRIHQHYVEPGYPETRAGDEIAARARPALAAVLAV